jgi:hypothetical protein
MIRAAIVVTVLVLGSSPAHAMPCWMMRKAVAQYGAAAVEARARAHGIPDKEVRTAKPCLS